MRKLITVLFLLPTIAFAIVGAKWAFSIFGVQMDLLGAVGMIVLAGIVVNNAIVLVDYANTLRGRGMALHEAIVQAGLDWPERRRTMSNMLTLFLPPM